MSYIDTICISIMNSRFIKGRRQDALAEIEGWITEARLQTAKGKLYRMTNEFGPIAFQPTESL